MRKYRIVLIMAVLALSACSKESNVVSPSKERKDIELTKAQQAIVPASLDFAFKFLHAVNAEHPDENIFISPLSMQSVLAMTAAGTEGVTRDEILETIGFAGFNPEDVSSFFQTLTPALMKVDNNVALSMASSIWAKPIMGLKSDYAKMAEKCFGATSHEMSDNLDANQQKIDKWVSAATKGMIKEFEIDPDSDAVLLNALYFNGAWATPFDARLTGKDMFRNGDGSRSKVEFMHRRGRLVFNCGEFWRSVSIPYGNGAYRMTIVIPDETESASSGHYIGALCPEMWKQMSNGGTRDVNLDMPKFECDPGQLDITSIMKSMGIREAFLPRGQFSPMFKNLNACVNKIKQRSVIKVNETGTETSSVSSVEIMDGAAGPGYEPPKPIEFKVDRPFFYAISEVSTGVILFAGIQKNL